MTSARPHVIALIIFCLLGSAGISAAVPVINELMFHPVDASGKEIPGAEYLEILNVDPAEADLSGWQLTAGVQFTFPAGTIIGPNGYLVVCANTAAFDAKHPGVANRIGNWTGTLSNQCEKVELTDSFGVVVDEVNYATEGDWAIRRRPTAAETDPPGGDAFAQTHGWIWRADADGSGKSLELRQPFLTNNSGQNWKPSATTNGTPGAANSVVTNNLPPMILNVGHSPSVPTHTDLVAVTADLVDEAPASVTATLKWRVATASPGLFSSVLMKDDGLGADERAGDHRFTALIVPAQPAGTIVEFYVSATDGTLTRTYPAPTDDVGGQGANCLYQVDEGVAPNSLEDYRLVLMPADKSDFDGIADTDTNALFNATFIHRIGEETSVRYLAGMRLRGSGSRNSLPRSVRLDLPNDRLWQKRSALNLNSQFPWLQVLGGHFAKSSGLPAASAELVNLRMNGGFMNGHTTNFNRHYDLYAHVEPLGGEFLDATLPADNKGDFYDKRSETSADWAYRSGNIATYLNDGWQKETNKGVNDWTQLDHFLQVINAVSSDSNISTPELAQLQAVGDLPEWYRYFAMNAILTNGENSLATGRDDDYSVYFASTGLMKLIPHDFDTILGDGDSSRITIADLPYTILDVVEAGNAGSTLTPLIPLFDRGDVARAYYKVLKELLDGPFSPAVFDAQVDALLLGTPVPQAKIDGIKSFMAARRADILAKIQKPLTATSSATVQSGFPRTTTNSTALSGTFNGTLGAAVTVNGVAATLDPRAGTWSLASGGITLTPGVNRLLVEEKDGASVVLRRAFIDVWYDDASQVTAPAAIAANTLWTAAGGPYRISASMTINSGATLTIEPGTTLRIGSSSSTVNLTVAAGGRILAEGTSAKPIRFMAPPGAAYQWGGMVINGTASGTPETRIAYAHFEGNSTTAIHTQSGAVVNFSHLTFGNTAEQYLSLDASSFDVSDCVFPTATGNFEPVHGTGGIKAGGHGIFRRNLHGAATGYNDVIDFTGGNRPGPILQVYDSVFIGSGDDELDLDGTDVWVEGNVFLHAHKNGSPDSASAISGGSDSGSQSEVTVVRNVFYDCDQAATAKQGNFYALANNTIVKITKTGGLDTASGVINLADDGTTAGAGFHLENNVITNAESLTRNYNAAQSAVTMNGNILPLSWSGPGSGNVVTAEPGLAAKKDLESLTPSAAISDLASQPWWDLTYPRYRGLFALSEGSVARGSGFGGTDKGALISAGIRASGTPSAVTASNSAILTFAPRGSITTPTTTYNWGYTTYRWKLDGGALSAEINSATPLSLSGLTPGPHTLELTGKNDAGEFQTTPTVLSWTVNPAYTPPVMISEVLAINTTAFPNNGQHPDYIELYNPGSASVELSGWSISDDPLFPDKFVFPEGTSIPAGERLLLLADTSDGSPGLHLDFSLDGGGEDVVLTKSAAAGGGVADSISFGLQIPNLSIGRIGASNTWTLNQPTPDAANAAQPFSGPEGVRINEWVASAVVSFKNDFIELYNASALPAALGGLFLSDDPLAPAEHAIKPLSFIPGGGFAVFRAAKLDAPVADATQLTFGLDAFSDWIILSASDGARIDAVEFHSEVDDVSRGRVPDGANLIEAFTLPTFGFSNGAAPVTTTTVTTLVPLKAAGWQYDVTSASTPANWRTTGGSNWQTGAGALGHDTDLSSVNATFFGTDIGTIDGAKKTYFFRKTFNFSGNAAQTQLRFTDYVDDGAVIYINGVEAHNGAFPRINMGGTPGTTVAYGDDASSTAEIGTTGGAINPPQASADIPAAGLLVNGSNTLAVEVHQRGTTSTDLVFDLKVEALTSSTTIPPEPAEYVRMRDLLQNLRITELMYDPANGTNFEFVELRNLSLTKTLDLAGVRFVKGINFVFPAMNLAPGAYVCVVNNLAAFRSIYGAAPAVAGVYAGKLSNGGDELILQLPAPWLAAIQIFTYNDWWYASADGAGSSLEILNPSTSRRAWNERSAWQASGAPGGSPGGQFAVASFATWASAYGINGANNDADHDGFDHLAEYGLGLLPVVADVAEGTPSQMITPDGFLHYQFTLPVLAPGDVTYRVETSSSVEAGGWQTVATKTGSGPWTGSAIITAAAPSGGRVAIDVAIPALPAAPRLFVRMRMSLP